MQLFYLNNTKITLTLKIGPKPPCPKLFQENLLVAFLIITIRVLPRTFKIFNLNLHSHSFFLCLYESENWIIMWYCYNSIKICVPIFISSPSRSSLSEYQFIVIVTFLWLCNFCNLCVSKSDHTTFFFLWCYKCYNKYIECLIEVVIMKLEA